MANFFSTSGADDQRSDSSHLDGGGDFFSFGDAPLFKTEDNSGGSFFGNSSSSGDGRDHESLFKPSATSKNDESFLDFGSAFSKPEGSSTEAEPTFLAPFSRTPPRKKQNLGPPPTPVYQPPLHHSVGAAKMDCSSTSSPHPLGMSSRRAVPGPEPGLSDPSSNSQTFGGALASPVQQNSNTQIKAASGTVLDEVNAQSMCSTQQHGTGIGVHGKGDPVKELQESSKDFDEHRQQFKEMSGGLMFESKCGVEAVGNNVRKEEKFGDTSLPLGRVGGSVGEFKSGGEPMGREPTGGGHLVGGGQGLLQQLLVGKVYTITHELGILDPSEQDPVCRK